MDDPRLPLLGLILLFLGGCMPMSSIILGQPDRSDLERMPYRRIEAADNTFEFATAGKDLGERIKVNDWSSDLPVFKNLNELAASHEIRSLLVIRNDSLLSAYYGLGQSKEHLHPSYSIAKSFTSALIGIAIDEGHIPSVQSKVSDYFPELKAHPEAASLSIEHLLNHTSGIAYTLPMDAVLYYGKNMEKALRKIHFTDPPGKRQSYLNINVQLLGWILQKATGKRPADYLQEKIWSKIGTSNPAIWSVDKTHEMEKTYCCLGATAEDYARFGRLYLNKGNWEGEQIVPKSWVERSIRRDTTAGSSFNYNYCWHIGLKEYGDFMANGLYKQHIYLNPKKNIIIVLLANKEDKLKAERVNWWYVFRQISDQL